MHLSLSTHFPLCYTLSMIIQHTRDTLSSTYLDSMRIRHKVFVEGQGVPEAIEIDKDEALCIHFVLYDETHHAAATARLLPDKTTALIQRVAVLSDYQGQGLGSLIIKALEDFASEQGFLELHLHAQLAARGFYDRLGYKTYGEAFFEAGIEHIHMKKEL